MRSFSRNRALRANVGLVLLAAVVPLLAGWGPSLEQRFQSHIDYLASDRLEGRGVGSAGIELAAEYIAAQFAKAGIEPAGVDGTFFQPFEITLRRTLTDKSRLAFKGDSAEWRLRADYTPFNFSSDESFSGEVVFCGYGIDAPDRDRGDFVHKDVNGKIVLMLLGEPPSWADEDGNTTPHAMIRNKVYNAKDRGAAAVLLVNQTPGEGEDDELTDFVAERADAYGIPAFHVSRGMADAQLAQAGLDTLTVLQERLDKGKYASAALPGADASGRAVFDKNSATTRNVVGLVRGTGPMANEFVVIGAHYDHLGIRKPMMRKFKAGKLVREARVPEIHNGADDNASGTSGLIEIAGMFAAGERPRRSILFVAFTAEESGLHGSKHYVEHPPAPLEKTVAMLNMDMIGRMNPDDDSVQVFGVDCGTGFRQLVEEVGGSVGLTIKPSPEAGGRSDHAQFVRNEIPSMHFFSGHHSDYHKPSDDADKINAAGGAMVISLVYRVADRLARREGRPSFQAVKTKKKDQAGGTPTYRVVMGLAPGYGDDGKPGMAVEAVNPEGPADMSGMKAGDRVIRIGGKDIANIYDYMAATRKNKAGETVEVVVLRKGKKLTLQVTLAPAG